MAHLHISVFVQQAVVEPYIRHWSILIINDSPCSLEGWSTLGYDDIGSRYLCAGADLQSGSLSCAGHARMICSGVASAGQVTFAAITTNGNNIPAQGKSVDSIYAAVICLKIEP